MAKRWVGKEGGAAAALLVAGGLVLWIAADPRGEGGLDGAPAIDRKVAGGVAPAPSVERLGNAPRPAPDRKAPFSPGVVLVGRKPAPPGRARTATRRPPSVPLERARGWQQALGALRRVQDAAPGGKAEGEAGPPGRLLEPLRGAFGKTADPLVRQNLIFLAALALPPGEGLPWIREIEATGDAADREDALLALAFSGEADAVAAFLDLSRTPSAAPVHRLLDTVAQHE
ncbi:MAG: hypothetical protein ACC662_07690, partial [Planctomycetota bacterium]